MGLAISVLCVASIGFLLAGYSRAAPHKPVADSDDIADWPPVLPPSAMAHMAAIGVEDSRRDLRSDWVHTGLRAAD
jgi:hypothetical protein